MMNLDNIDYSAAKFWVDIAQTLFLAGVTIYVWVNGRLKVNKTAIETVEDRVAILEQSDTVYEKDIKRLITELEKVETRTDGDVKRIHKRIDELSAQMNKMEGTATETNHMVKMINSYLIKKD